jgi:hypothetical protein
MSFPFPPVAVIARDHEANNEDIISCKSLNEND